MVSDRPESKAFLDAQAALGGCVLVVLGVVGIIVGIMWAAIALGD